MRCFTILGPSQTGKSTLVEKLASLEGTPKKSVSPYGLGLTEFDIRQRSLVRVGFVRFGRSHLAHAQDALVASDACILCVSPVPEEAVLAAPYLRVIEASGTPCILFVNRMDEPRGRLRDVIASLQDYRQSHPAAPADSDQGRGQDRRQLRSDFRACLALPRGPDLLADRDSRKMKWSANTRLVPNSWNIFPNSMTGFWKSSSKTANRPSDAIYAISSRVLP